MRLTALYRFEGVLLPGESVVLRISSTADRQFLNDFKDTQRSFAVCNADACQEQDIATLVVIKEVKSKYSNGDLDILVLAVGLCKLVQTFERHPLKLYSAATVLELAHEIYTAEASLINVFKKYAYRYLPKQMLPKTISGDLFQIAALLGLTVEQKRMLIGLFNPIKMNRLLRNIIRTKSALYNQESRLHGNFHLN
ncbi:MAG TPA: hypothetical protein VFV37_00595 [Luteibaculaceae bacterium]|nr:hypothetical protein [Luteibaculaceae bacterium]